MAEPAGSLLRPGRDGARLAYLALLGVVGVQAFVVADPARLWVDALPLIVAAIVVTALPCQLGRMPDLSERWPRWLAGAGAALGAWALVAAVTAVVRTPPNAAGFYLVKQQVTTPLGAHNAAASLLLAGVAAAAVVTARRPRWWPALALSALGLAATLSRGAALVLVVVAALAPALARRRVAALLAVAGAGALGLVLLAAVVLGAAPPSSLEPGGRAVESSVEVRVDLWQRAAETVADQPLLGVGIGRFGTVTGDLPEPWPHAHNLELHALAELGLLGAVAYLVLWGVLALRTWRAPPSGARSTVALAGLALFAHAQIELVALTGAFELLLAILLVAAGAATVRPSV